MKFLSVRWVMLSNVTRVPSDRLNETEPPSVVWLSRAWMMLSPLPVVISQFLSSPKT